MASLKCKLFNVFLRTIRMKQSWELAMTTGKIKASLNLPIPPEKLFQKINKQVAITNGHNVFTLSPRDHPTDLFILYVHGGGFLYNMTKFHWKFATSLVEQLHCTILLPDYPLLPDHTYEDFYQMIEPLYKDLIASHGSANTVVMGDSAGAGLCLSLMQKMKTINVDQPSQIILLSPWLDLSLSNPEINSIDAKDAFLEVKGLRMAGKAYAGNADVSNYLVSPINGPVKGLAKINVFMGTHDICAADARKFKALCESNGVSINYFEYDEMPHNWTLFGFPESIKSVNEMIDLLDPLSRR